MTLMRRKGPTDGVARMDPEFIRQKGQRLASPIGALRAHAYLPLGLDQLRDDQNRQRQRPTECRRKSREVESNHCPSQEQFLRRQFKFKKSKCVVRSLVLRFFSQASPDGDSRAR